MKIDILLYLDLKSLNRFSFCASSRKLLNYFDFFCYLKQLQTCLHLLSSIDETLSLLKPFHVVADVDLSGLLSSFMVKSALLLLPLDYVTAIHRVVG